MENVNVYETVMAIKHVGMIQSMDNADAHLLRYIANRNKRTGNIWRVIGRYFTDGCGQRTTDPLGWGYERAVIENEHGHRVRIFHDATYWRAS